MGISSTTIVSAAIQLCVFDLRRGQQEGQEIDKILYFFPTDCAYSAQLSVLGLSEGLITFTRIFSPDAACEVIEAEKRSYIFHAAEPDIWMVLVVEKDKDTQAAWRSTALEGLLKELHHLFMMFHGSVRALLDKQPTGLLARTHLYYFINDYLADFLVGKKFRIPSFRDCLKECGTIQMLSVGKETAVEVQHDTANLVTYATMRLTPHALSSQKNSWSSLHKGSSASHVVTGSMLVHAGFFSEEIFYTPHDTFSARHDQPFHVIRPLQTEKWTKGKDGFLTTDAWHTEDNLNSTPTVWLRQTEEQMYLSIFQHKNLTVVFLVPVCSLVNGEQGLVLVKQQILENAYQKMLNVHEKLSQGWGGENANHVKGYRYLLLNNDQNISKASPPGKVLTLAKESLLALNRLRLDVDLEKSRAKCDDCEQEKDLEVCIRAKNNAWVIARTARGNELYIVLEKANDTLVYASDAVDKFCNRYCREVFSLDY